MTYCSKNNNIYIKVVKVTRDQLQIELPRHAYFVWREYMSQEFKEDKSICTWKFREHFWDAGGNVIVVLGMQSFIEDDTFEFVLERDRKYNYFKLNSDGKILENYYIDKNHITE